MATLDEIGAFLATACSRTVGTDLFKGQLPSSPDASMAVVEYMGSAPDYVFGTSGVSVEYPRVQVVCRGAEGDYATPRAAIETAYRAMAAASAQSLSGTRYLAMRPLQAPFLLTKDDKGRIVLAFNCELQKGLS